MRPDWHLRLARPEDAEHLPAIERAAARLFKDEPELEGLDLDHTWQAEDLRRLIRKGHCLVAYIGEPLVGFIATQPFQRELHVWELSVAPAAQRLGIGAGLMRACLIDARNAGFSAVTLTTFRDIAWNGPFYAGLGFVELSDPASHSRLAEMLASEAESGLPRERRCAMIYTMG
ncbi:MAG: GNAT family N-acetyltransferase [Sphingomonadaceae bacterium]|nr:GNAT family N-acetyltransferase [Sphingomonadaceae bacterium]